MCTVSYIPKKDGFILTSNRDENPMRGSAIPPHRYEVKGLSVFCPKDPVSGGTWLLTSDNNYTLCLLNGAFVAHEKKQNYRHSRGRVILDFFTYENQAEFVEKYNLQDIEPFTLLMIQVVNTGVLFSVLRWDGLQKHVEVLDPHERHVFSSATLYSDEIKNLRQVWLEEYMELTPRVSIAKMIQFHTQTHLEDTFNGVLIDRGPNLKTVSVCSIDYSRNRTRMTYVDLLKNKKYQYRIMHLKVDQ